MSSRPAVFKRKKGAKIPKDYAYCPGCKEFTLAKDVGMCSSDCCCDKFKCLNCGKISYAEYD